MTDNLKLWGLVEKTDTKHTKPAKKRTVFVYRYRPYVSVQKGY